MKKRNTKKNSKRKIDAKPKKVAKKKKLKPLKVGDVSYVNDSMANSTDNGTSFFGKDLAGLGFAIGTVVAVNLLGANNASAQVCSFVCTGGTASFCFVCAVCST